MLLSLGLTADAAAAHRHEFSNVISSSASKGTAPRSRPSSARLPMPLGVDIRRRPVAGIPSMSSLPTSYNQQTLPDDDCDSLSDSDESRAPSTGGPATPRAETSRPTPRSKTAYHLAHPPPSFINRQRLLIRPRLLLQLQRISGSTRPSPVLDVLPSTILPPGLARRFPVFFRGKDRLGPDDLVIVKSEEYKSSATVDSSDTEETDAEISESRHVIATISQRRKDDGGVQGKAEICLNNGRVWEATPLTNGGYEFSTTNDDGLRTTARWVRRPSLSRQRSGTGKKAAHRAAGRNEKRLGFSLLNPNSRRHPILASLTRTSIDVFDKYPTSVPSTTMHSPLATPDGSNTAIPSPMTSFFDSSLELGLKPTDKDLRTLILVTGIWVAFREGWCQGFRNQGPISPVSRPTSTTAASSGTSPRSVSAPVAKQTNSRLVHPESPLKPQSPESHVSRIRSPGVTLAPERRTTQPPRRAHSTGTASGHRIDSRRHTTDHQAPQPFLGMLSSHHEDPGPVATGSTSEPGHNRVSNDSSVRFSVPRFTHRRAQSVHVPITDTHQGHHDDGGREVPQTNAVAKRRWGKLKRLLGFVRKRPHDR